MLVGAHQPNFMPWAGYFSKVLACDAFVIMDDAQIPQGRSYASRAKVRSGGEGKWLSLPIFKKSGQQYRDAKIADLGVYDQHLKVIRHAYGKAPFFDETFAFIDQIYGKRHAALLDFNLDVIRGMLDLFGYAGDLKLSSDVGSDLASSAWLAQLTKLAGGDAYLSGPGGASYIDPEVFQANGVRLQFGQYTPIAYESPKFEFISGLSLIDALFVVGKDASRDILKYDLTE